MKLLTGLILLAGTTPCFGTETALPSNGTWSFIGCRYSYGECSNSCEDRKGMGELDREKCAADLRSPIACYCWRKNPEVPNPTPY